MTVILATSRTNGLVPRSDPVPTTSTNSSNCTTNCTINHPSCCPISASCLQRQRVSSNRSQSPSSITSPSIRQRGHGIISTHAGFTPSQKSITLSNLFNYLASSHHFSCFSRTFSLFYLLFPRPKSQKESLNYLVALTICCTLINLFAPIVCINNLFVAHSFLFLPI